MNIIIRANNAQFKEERKMCEAILELFEDEVIIRTEKARNEGKLEEKQEGIKSTINSCKDLGGTQEQILELLVKNSNITHEEAQDYIEKYW